MARVLGQSTPQASQLRAPSWRTASPRRLHGPVSCTPRFIDIGDEWIEVPRKRQELWPNFELTWEEALELQLNALQANNEPYPDHGIEVMYRFANFDPFVRSQYFGRPYDLGQFERFRRLMHTRYYGTLLCHTGRDTLSSLQVDAHTWKQRFLVRGFAPGDERTYEITMRLGGRYDGYWFADSLICAEEGWEELRQSGI